MSGFSFTVAFLVTWAVWSPASFGRHLAAIADSFEAERNKLRANAKASVATRGDVRDEPRG